MRVENHTADFEYACLFCRSRSETHLAQELRNRWPQVDFIVPEKIRIRRKGAEVLEENVVLFPGYIFMRTTEDIAALPLFCVPNVYRILMDSEKNWKLRGTDRALAEALFQTGGVVGLSTAYYDGNRIRIVDGFLKEYEGKILRVNRRRKTAQICVTIEEKEMMIWLGFELIDQMDDGGGAAGMEEYESL